MPSILPKGIVVNTRGISGDIQRIDREPLAVEEIAKLWKVYTTTRRRLLDPTAERLENYWWRLWGSRKRHLSGAAVARLFANISDGTSFVPLRGPCNRDESGGQLGPSLHRGPGTASTTAIRDGSESQSSNGPPLSSSSKNTSAMPPPILKKSRGPSSVGPRPTARFISPHSSEDEEAAQDSSSTTSLNARVIVRPPTPESQVPREEKKAEPSAGSRRRVHQFPASNAGHKRRPNVARRPSSDPVNKTQETAQVTLPSREPLSSFPEATSHRKALGKLQSDYQSPESSSPSPKDRHEGRSSKRVRPSKKGQPKVSVGQSSASRSNSNEMTRKSSGASAVMEQATPGREMPLAGKGQEVPLKALEPTQATMVDPGSQYRMPSSARSELKGDVTLPSGSRTDLARSQQMRAGSAYQKNLDFKSSISLEPTYTAASGSLDFRSQSIAASAKDVGGPDVAEGHGEGAAGSSQTSLFARRSVQPAKSASALFASSSTPREDPISRSKSQLTLLLEKDRVKSSDHRKKPTSSKAKEPEHRK